MTVGLRISMASMLAVGFLLIVTPVVAAETVSCIYAGDAGAGRP